MREIDEKTLAGRLTQKELRVLKKLWWLYFISYLLPFKGLREKLDTHYGICQCIIFGIKENVLANRILINILRYGVDPKMFKPNNKFYANDLGRPYRYTELLGMSIYWWDYGKVYPRFKAIHKTLKMIKKNETSKV